MKRAARRAGAAPRGKARRRYEVAHRDELPAVPCPCGEARRGFGRDGCPASVHWVEIQADAEAHWHTRHTEIYVVLAGRGWLEIDGDRVPLSPGTAVWIRPGARHRARGRLTILNVVVPPFDPGDEHLVAEDGARAGLRARRAASRGGARAAGGTGSTAAPRRAARARRG